MIDRSKEISVVSCNMAAFLLTRGHRLSIYRKDLKAKNPNSFVMFFQVDDTIYDDLKLYTQHDYYGLFSAIKHDSLDKERAWSWEQK